MELKVKYSIRFKRGLRLAVKRGIPQYSTDRFHVSVSKKIWYASGSSFFVMWAALFTFPENVIKYNQVQNRLVILKDG